VVTKWFDSGGPQHTDAVIEAVIERLKRDDIEHVVVATTTGGTGVRFLQALAESRTKLVFVTHYAGFREADELELDPKHATTLREAGAPILTTSHILGGVGRSISRKFGGTTPGEIIAHTLRLFGQGMKVCVEIAVMAADAGLIPTDRDVITVGGTGRGADTSVVLRSAHTRNVFDLKIREILCRPIDW
jgi:hypothetical protein